MYLKFSAFERLAKRNGYKNGYRLIKVLGCFPSEYKLMKLGEPVNPDLVAEIFNRFGEEAMFDVIDFADDKGDL